MNEDNQTAVIDLVDLDATMAVGRRLASLLFPGAVVALVGPLGAGKTHLVRAIAEGLGLRDSRVVTSPTFVLIQEYDGNVPIYHFDAYRLRGATEFAELGVQDYFEDDGVCLVEWADRVQDCLPAKLLHVRLAMTSPVDRRMTVSGIGGRYCAVVRELQASFPHRAPLPCE